MITFWERLRYCEKGHPSNYNENAHSWVTLSIWSLHKMFNLFLHKTRTAKTSLKDWSWPYIVWKNSLIIRLEIKFLPELLNWSIKENLGFCCTLWSHNQLFKINNYKEIMKWRIMAPQVLNLPSPLILKQRHFMLDQFAVASLNLLHLLAYFHTNFFLVFGYGLVS